MHLSRIPDGLIVACLSLELRIDQQSWRELLRTGWAPRLLEKQSDGYTSFHRWSKSEPTGWPGTFTELRAQERTEPERVRLVVEATARPPAIGEALELMQLARLRAGSTIEASFGFGGDGCAASAVGPLSPLIVDELLGGARIELDEGFWRGQWEHVTRHFWLVQRAPAVLVAGPAPRSR